MPDLPLAYLDRSNKPESERVVPASQLEAWIRLNKARVWIRGAVFDRKVDLSSLTFDHPLTLLDCTFREPLDLHDTMLKRSADFTGCVFEKNVNFTGTRVEGSLILNRATILPSAPEADRESQEESDPGVAPFKLIRVQGDLIARGLTAGEWPEVEGGLMHDDEELFQHLEGHPGRLDLNFTGARVEGDFILASTPRTLTRCRGGILLVNAKVLGNVELQGSVVAGKLDLELASVEGDVNANPLLDAQGEVARWTSLGQGARLIGCEVGGEVGLTGARLGAAGVPAMQKFGLTLQCAHVKGGLFCRAFKGCRPRLAGGISLAGAHVSGTADFDGADITGDIFAEGAVIDGSLFFRPDSSPAPAAPHPDGEPSPAGASTEIAGHLFLATIRVTGRTELLGSRIHGSVNLRGAELGSALDCSVWQPPQDPSTRQAGQPLPTHIQGVVDLAEAEIAGLVDFSGARIGYPLAPASGATKGTDPKGASPEEAPAPSWALNAEGARLALGFSLAGAHLRGGLLLQGAEIRGSLICRALPLAGDFGTRIEGLVMLDGATVTELADFDHAILGPRLAEEQRLLLEKTLATPQSLHQLEEEVRAGGREFANATGKDLAKLLASAESPEGQEAVIRRASKEVADAVGSELARRLGRTERAEQVVAAWVEAVGEEIARYVDKRLARLLEAELTTLMKAALGRLTGVFALSGERAKLGALNLAGTKVYGKLYLESARIEGGLFDKWRQVDDAEVSGEVDLSNARVGDLQLYFTALEHGGDGEAGARAERKFPRIVLEGCSFQELHLPCRHDAGAKAEVSGYDLLPDVLRRSNFPVATCVVIEGWLRDRGEDRAADNLYLAMRRNARKSMPPLKRLRDSFWELTQYGLVKHVWAGFGLLALAVLSFLAFRSPEAVVPADTTAPAREWTATDAAALAGHTVVPVFRPRTVDNWQVSGNPARLFSLPCCWRSHEGEVMWGTYADYEVAFSLAAGGLWSLLGLGLVSHLMKERFERRIKSRLDAREAGRP